MIQAFARDEILDCLQRTILFCSRAGRTTFLKICERTAHSSMVDGLDNPVDMTPGDGVDLRFGQFGGENFRIRWTWVDGQPQGVEATLNLPGITFYARSGECDIDITRFVEYEGIWEYVNEIGESRSLTVPGVEAEGGPKGSQSQPNIRGFGSTGWGSNRVVTTIDGVRRAGDGTRLVQ